MIRLWQLGILGIQGNDNKFLGQDFCLFGRAKLCGVCRMFGFLLKVFWSYSMCQQDPVPADLYLNQSVMYIFQGLEQESNLPQIFSISRFFCNMMPYIWTLSRIPSLLLDHSHYIGQAQVSAIKKKLHFYVFTEDLSIQSEKKMKSFSQKQLSHIQQEQDFQRRFQIVHRQSKFFCYVQMQNLSCALKGNLYRISLGLEFLTQISYCFFSHNQKMQYEQYLANFYHNRMSDRKVPEQEETFYPSRKKTHFYYQKYSRAPSLQTRSAPFQSSSIYQNYQHCLIKCLILQQYQKFLFLNIFVSILTADPGLVFNDCIYFYQEAMQVTKNQLSAYTLIKTLGRGTFGKVKLAIHTKTGQPVAIKILQKNKIKDVTDVERVSRELHILKITQHASVAQMYEVIENQSTIFIVMEYAPYGQFFDYIMDGKIADETEAHFYFVQIVRVLEYLHRLKISHRDIKPENMLLDDERRLKIVDFGLSNMYKKGQNLLTACGSPCYASPEMIKGEPYNPELTDVWSLGVVLFSMVMAKLPFEDDNTSVLYGKIKAGLYIIDKKISADLKDLISRLLCVDPTKRFNLQQIKNHQWYKQKQILKLCGVRVGFETAALDEQILNEMKEYGYEISQIRRYLENNIRNEITAAYYLLMKKRFRNGNPSKYDLSNENFDPKSLIPKGSLVTQPKKRNTLRHKSFDIYLSLKELEKFDDKSTGRYSCKKQSSRKQKRDRKCHSQQKSYEFQRGFNPRNSIKHKNGQFTALSRSLKKNSGNKIKQESPLKLKRSDKSLKSIDKKSSTKGLQKQHNISINVYINNAKIEAPSHLRHPKKKQSKKNLNLHREIVNLTREPLYQTNLKTMNKRLKTEAIDRQCTREVSTDKKDGSYRRINRKEVNVSKEYEGHNRSLQKSDEVSNIFDGGAFWKKKSATHQREYTTEARAGRSKYRYY